MKNNLSFPPQSPHALSFLNKAGLLQILLFSLLCFQCKDDDPATPAYLYASDGYFAMCIKLPKG